MSECPQDSRRGIHCETNQQPKPFRKEDLPFEDYSLISRVEVDPE